MYDRLKTATEIFEHFTGTEWYFHNENVRSLYSELNSKDKEVSCSTASDSHFLTLVVHVTQMSPGYTADSSENTVT